MNQDFIEAHDKRLTRTIKDFMSIVTPAIYATSDEIESALNSGLQTDSSGRVVLSNQNLVLLSSVYGMFTTGLLRHGYYRAVQELAITATGQVDEFSRAYAHMARENSELPAEYNFAEPEIVSTYSGNLAFALISEMNKVASAISAKVNYFLSTASKASVIKEIIDMVRGFKRIEQTASDLLVIFFRTICSLNYSLLEKAGYALLFQYVGVRDHKNRNFCADLLDISDLYTRAQIDAMDNGQTPSVFETCGGYGCRHWWWIAKVVETSAV